MPYADGYELIRQVRSLPAKRAYPGDCAAAFARSEDRTRASQAGYLVCAQAGGPG